MEISRDLDKNFLENGKLKNPEFLGKFRVTLSREETQNTRQVSGQARLQDFVKIGGALKSKLRFFSKNVFIRKRAEQSGETQEYQRQARIWSSAVARATEVRGH